MEFWGDLKKKKKTSLEGYVDHVIYRDYILNRRFFIFFIYCSLACSWDFRDQGGTENAAVLSSQEESSDRGNASRLFLLLPSQRRAHNCHASYRPRAIHQNTKQCRSAVKDFHNVEGRTDTSFGFGTCRRKALSSL